MSLGLLTVVHGKAAEFPKLYNSEEDKTSALSPQDALAKLKLPDGFKATMFAAEPDVQNPIAMAWDARGRLWIAENFTYAESDVKFDLDLRDRILIFEDKDNDGHFDSRKIFTEEAQMLTSIEIGNGGVWALCPPQLLFIPDKDGNDIPNGPPQVVLDGFKVPAQNYHNFANGLRWGPDGWLYGRCGASAPGEIGAPNTPNDARLPLRGGIWRYHPQRKTLEVLSSGTVNPWGNDWNEYGEEFFINTVSGHLWHMIPGAHFVAAHAIDPNQHAYELLDMHADHFHFDTGKSWTESREGAADVYGGGHSHIGAMVYLGDNWPIEYRGNLLTLNQHGRRGNQEILERSGSGYVAKHKNDCFIFGDPWFRGIDLSYGPDGGVFVLDWSDTGECHDSTGVHRTSGRIYKISYGVSKLSQRADLTKLSVEQLVKLHSHQNEWFVRQARRQLVERATTGLELQTAKKNLRALFQNETNVIIQLRALWSLYSIGAGDEDFLRAQLNHANEHVRTWAIRLLTDSWPLDTIISTRPKNRVEPIISPTILNEFVALGKSDSSALVRLALASTLQRLPFADRNKLAAALLAHSEDANDHNLPLMIWYGIISIGNTSPTSLMKLATDSKIPTVNKFIARRLGEEIEKNPAPLNQLLRLATDKSESFQFDILSGLSDALRGWSKAKKPENWDALQQKLVKTQNDPLRNLVRELAVVFGDGRALDELKQIALNNKNSLTTRRAALETLIEKRPPDLRQICEQLLKVRFLNSTAVRGLALFDDPAIGEKLAKSYGQFHQTERPAVIEALASRPSFARALLEEISANRIPRADLSPFHARQILSFNDPTISKTLTQVWGELHDSSAEKKAFMAELKNTKLTPKELAGANKFQGRVVFEKACSSCHTLHGIGGKIGPDLTGSGRENLDYLLENIVDPSAVVTADFRVSTLELKDGRILSGLITAKTDRTVTLKTINETLTLERTEIETIQESSASLMPEGLLESLSEAEVRNLIAYLMHPAQVPSEK